MTNVSRFIPDPEQAALVVVDIQKRLVPAMPENVSEMVLRNTGILIKGVREFDIPIILLEQYPEGLGCTVGKIKDLLLDLEPIKKVAFNCCDVPEFVESLKSISRRDVILCGMETHICILQSALGLLGMDQRVFVAADAVCSRAKHNWEFGLSLMRAAGVMIGTTEIILFLMSRAADTERFIKISRLVK
ncbi:MAG: isochorismatase family protein [Anaerolineaceae bacterium]|nr:isochorismatase family protein [Anaerolineaceae bacterium]